MRSLGRRSGGEFGDRLHVSKTDNRSVMFQYPGFVIAYESGVDQVAGFDASIEFFWRQGLYRHAIRQRSADKDDRLVKETPWDGSYREPTTRLTYEDPFTLELQEVYQLVVEGKPPKTSPTDARQDLEILGMLMWCGMNVTTPRLFEAGLPEYHDNMPG